jgi:hypothetical protein
MTNETLRMQMLSGIITEGEYKAAINKEIEEEEKASLNESMIGGIVGIGAINQIPSTPKTDYEMAFEHFLGERYQVKPNREKDDIDEDESGFGGMDPKGHGNIKDDSSLYEEDTVEDMEERTEEEMNEDVIKGSNVKKVDGKYRVLSGKSGKMWPQKYDSKKDAEDAIKAYHANK